MEFAWDDAKRANETVVNEALKSKINREKLRAAKDADIARQIAQDPDTAPEISVDALIAPKNLRRRLNMTQEEFADALDIPIATLRNGEQGRHGIDPAARSLLILIARDPEETLATLAAAGAA
jgi:putative transcriptional regulator